MTETMQQITDALIPILCLLITAGGGYLVALLRRQTQQIEKDLNSETASKYIELATAAVEQAVTYHSSATDRSRSNTGRRTGRKRSKNRISAGNLPRK